MRPKTEPALALVTPGFQKRNFLSLLATFVPQQAPVSALDFGVRWDPSSG